MSPLEIELRETKRRLDISDLAVESLRRSVVSWRNRALQAENDLAAVPLLRAAAQILKQEHKTNG